MAPPIYKKIFFPLINSFGRQVTEKRFSDEPIIIGGCGRSGTTLLLSILSAHPHIYAIQRQTYAFEKWEKIDRSDGKKVRTKEYKPARLDRLYRYFLLHRVPNSATRWCEKTPLHVRHFGKILDYFDDKVKLIHIIRDGRDVVTSKHPRHNNPGEYWVSVERWVNDVKAGLGFIDCPRVLTLHYEQLISDFANVIEKTYRFLGEECRFDVFSWVNLTSVKNSKHWANPVQKLHSRSIDRWKMPEHKERIEKFMKNDEAVVLLKRLKYF